MEEWLNGQRSVAAGVAYVQSEEGALRPLYADLHVHSDDTVGTNDATYNLTYGRDIAGLDVVGYTVNDFNSTEANWDEAVKIRLALRCEKVTPICGATNPPIEMTCRRFVSLKSRNSIIEPPCARQSLIL
ncbi:hypothetical protein [Rhizobium sp. LjRoot258]|uniref:hypothetical protein n=1 Tax=Rhizobium sp. LjRoot258 TaxID=3342299 RepID=UPI003F509F23